MSVREDIAAYLSDFRGVLGWNSFTEPFAGALRPHIEIPLYINEYNLPIRVPSMSEVSTVTTRDPGAKISTTTNALFFGAPEILQTQMSGFTITPINDYKFKPVDVDNNPLTFGNINYNDIIRYFIGGRFNRGVDGSWHRKDPDYFISPRGQKFTYVVISLFQPHGSPVAKYQGFDMTLMLEI